MTYYDRLGLILSGLVHVGVAVAAIVGLPRLTRDAPSLPEVISVEYVQIAEETTSPDPKPEPEPQPLEEVLPTPAPEQSDPVQPEPEAVPMPEPEQRSEKLSEAPAPETKPSPPVTVRPRTKPRPPSRLDSSRIAALIDRSIKEESPPPSETEDRDDDLAEAVERTRRTALQDRIAQATLQAVIQQKMRECWNVPAGARDAKDLEVRIRVRLRPDGSLARPPEVLDKSRLTQPGQEFYRAAAESAARAVQLCAPYEELPVAQHEIWKDMELHFDPGEMIGG